MPAVSASAWLPAPPLARSAWEPGPGRWPSGCGVAAAATEATATSGGNGARSATADLIWAAARPQPDLGSIAAAAAGPIDAELLVTASITDRVGPLVLRSLELSGACGHVGGGIEQLREDADMWRARSLLLPAALQLSIKPLQTSGMQPLIFKGPTLAVRYPTSALRPMVDIDLLLPAEAHRDAVAALNAGGWAVTLPIDALRHDTTLHHPDVPMIGLELHAALDTWRERATRLRAEQLTSSRVAVSCFGVETTMLPPEEELVALAVHAGKPFHCFDRLIWMVDLVVAAASANGGAGLDWERVADLAGQARCRTVLAVALTQAGRLGLEAPAQLRRLPRSRWRRAALAPLLEREWPLDPPTLRVRRISRFALPDDAATRVRLYAGEQPWRDPRDLLRDGPRAVRRLVAGARPGRIAKGRRHRTAIALASVTLAATLRLAPTPVVWRGVDLWARALPHRRLEGDDAADVAAMLGTRIDAVLGSPVVGVRGRCLKRSLILYGMLRRRGLRPRWTVGHLVSADGGFAVHAWCSLNGAAVAEPPGIADVYRGLLVREPA
jgi:hypothetical protein